MYRPLLGLLRPELTRLEGRAGEFLVCDLPVTTPERAPPPVEDRTPPGITAPPVLPYAPRVAPTIRELPKVRVLPEFRHE